MFVTTIPRQHQVDPSDSTIQDSDQTVFTLASGEVGYIQNLATVGLAVRYGAGASPTSLCFVLNGGTGASDGTGGSLKIDDWIGPVSVAAMSGTASYLAWKLA